MVILAWVTDNGHLCTDRNLNIKVDACREAEELAHRFQNSNIGVVSAVM